MKSKLLLFASLVVSLCAVAQQKNVGYAIVSNAPGTMSWLNIQQIDLSTGQVSRNIFETSKTQYTLLDAITKKKTTGVQLVATKITANNITVNTNKVGITDHPLATMVAAAAFDVRHSKLFYAPLRIGELRWVNLDEKNDALNVYCLRDAAFAGGDLVNEAANITRMTVAADGDGYALSNDGNKLIRFTTGKKTVVTNLGKISDATGNEISIHSRETSWGGDMIADASGNLYLISSYHAVFKINIDNLSAKFVGFIKGLPANYSTNGAAVDADGNVVVSSAQSAEGYFKVDLASCTAAKLPIGSQFFSSSDLASGNLAFSKDVVNAGAVINRPDVSLLQNISFYPNPVTTGSFKVAFRNNEPGPYSIQLVDLSGKIIQEKRVTISTASQTEDVPVHVGLARGMYFVKIINGHSNKLTTGQISLQ